MALAQHSTATRSKSNGNVLYLNFAELSSDRHPAIRQGNDRMRAANEAWNAVDARQFRDWKRYADTIKLTHPATGKVYHPTAKNAFVSNALKLLQIDPCAELPLDPPAVSFSGDSIDVSVCDASQDFFGCDSASTISLCSSGPNQPNTVTEVLVQKLKNCRRTPTKQYRSMGFIQFTEDCLSHEIPLEPGIYSCAYRFVNRTTGQSTKKVVLGTFEVE